MAAPQVLAYDDLPSGSDIRREHSPGLLRIVVPAGEPSGAALKQAWHDALVSSVWPCLGITIVALLAFQWLAWVNRISGALLAIAWVMHGVGCIALLLLFAWVQYQANSVALQVARRQTTVIAATPTRLLIESAGPFGTLSHDLPASHIRRIHIARRTWHDQRGRHYTLRNLRVQLEGEQARFIDIIPGRGRREMNLIASAILTVTHPPGPV